ncbi:MAG: hypothetical protein WD712_02780 [Candidatus Spechtbacterales bacterium]
MGKLERELKKLSVQERKLAKSILKQISRGSYKNLDIRKLKGYSDIFRVRKGKLRVIYRLRGDDVFALSIERRSDRTYKNI